jgi:hypothetical protein
MNSAEVIFVAIGSILCFCVGKYAYSKKCPTHQSKLTKFITAIIATPFVFYVWLGIGIEKIEYFLPSFIISAIIGAITQNAKKTNEE